MVTKLLILLFICESTGYKVQDAPLLTKRPHWLKVCKRSDPEVNKCLTDMFTQLFPHLAVGIPEINVEHFEPLALDKVSITKGNGPIILTGSFQDLDIAGASNSTPRDTDFFRNETYGHWNFGIDLPLLDIKSLYNLKGHILVLPLHGHGDCDLKLYQIQTNILTNVSFPLIEGREVLKIDTMKLQFKVGSMKINLSNLFNGNKVLGRTMNHFMNQNGLEIISELEDSLGESLAAIFKSLINNIFTKLPLDLWFLTDEEHDQYTNELKEAD